jgi:membrane-bound serine protease (ClpP class)
MKRGLAILIALVCGSGASLHAADAGLIKVNGAIGPATSAYISRAIQASSARKDACLIVELDTPGGLLDSTRDIVQSFYESKVPIVVYVAPSPARAASAGVFITMAADVAAMAPFTHIGAAHPVSLSPGGEVEKTDDVMKKKVENDAASFAESIANKRHRNADWARAAVVESESITAEKALQLNVIDLIAKDIPDLLQQIDKREINGEKLQVAGAAIVEIPMTFRENLLHAVLRPEVMFVLFLVVMYGIIGELSSPGAILPGVAGAIALILLLYMSTVLPPSLAGLALMGLAAVLFIIDIFAPTHGILTFGGIVSFFLGALMLFDRSDPTFRLSLAYIIPATLVTAAFFIFVVGAGLRAQFLPVRAGKEMMVGQTVTIIDPVDASHGKVFVEGEYWNAVSEAPIAMGQPAEITGMEGLTLRLKPKVAAQA